MGKAKRRVAASFRRTVPRRHGYVPVWESSVRIQRLFEESKTDFPWLFLSSGLRPIDKNSSMIALWAARAASAPVPPWPVFWTAKWNGVDPGLFLNVASQPRSNRNFTAAADRVRTARCKGAAPFLSWALISAPDSSRHWMVWTCRFGSHCGPLRNPSAA